MSRLSTLCFLLASLCILAPRTVAAAILFTEPPRLEALPGQTFQVDLYLDTQLDSINALEGRLVFPPESLTLKEVRDGNSIINFWVERPTNNQEPVQFSGIIPGGYTFPRGLVLSLIFEAKGTGEGAIGLESARTLLNDGKGTAAALSSASTLFRISSTTSNAIPPAPGIQDTDAPEPFTPELAHDASSFGGKWFLSFATQDKGSGIDHFEIRETTWWGDGSWVVGASPYVLQRQDPGRKIFVKAVDRAGNERTQSTNPVGAPRIPYEFFVLLGILCLIVAVVIFLSRKRGAGKDHRSAR